MNVVSPVTAARIAPVPARFRHDADTYGSSDNDANSIIPAHKHSAPSSQEKSNFWSTIFSLVALSSSWATIFGALAALKAPKGQKFNHFSERFLGDFGMVLPVSILTAVTLTPQSFGPTLGLQSQASA